VNDQRRGQVYSRAFRDIMVAARNGGSPDPERNVALFNAVKKARADGVPKANIESALQKAAGGKDGAGQLITYEVLAHGSVGLIMYVQHLSPARFPSSWHRAVVTDSRKRMPDRQWESNATPNPRDPQRAQVRRLVPSLRAEDDGL